MSFIIAHIYREDNHYADKLANLGLSLTDLTWWDIAPSSIREELARIRLVFLVLDFAKFECLVWSPSFAHRKFYIKSTK
jgi:hypothetical protein